MKRTVWPLLLAVCLGAEEITAMAPLFQRLKEQPITRMDEAQARAEKVAAQTIKAKLLPTFSLFGSYEHYNAPTNLRPVSPAESLALGQAGEPLPFAQTIERIGMKARMPLFSKSLLSLLESAHTRALGAKAKARLKLLNNEAILLGTMARWHFLQASDRAVEGRIASIEKTLADTRVAVSSGRAPGVAIDKLQEALNRLQIARNDIAIQITDIKAKIEELTGLTLDSPVPLRKKGFVQEGELFAAKPDALALKAREKNLQSAYDALWPTIGLSAYWSENYGQNPVGYTSDVADDVHRGYGNYMLTLSMPLFDLSLYRQIERSRVMLARERFKLNQTRRSLLAKARALKRQLILYERSQTLAQKSVKNRTALLEYAKVAFETGRMSEEEYLRYEEELLQAESKRDEAAAMAWQALARLAVIYGNDLSEIVE